MVSRIDSLVPTLTLQNARGAKGPSEVGTGFGDMLRDALDSVNQLQLDAADAAQALALGDVQDVHTVMLASAKADLALQLTLQIRNKMIDAYQEISRMQI